MAANFAFRTGSEKRKLFAYGYVLCVEITRIPLQVDFKLVSIVERFRGGRVWKQVKVVQIPMTKADLFLGIFEAIPGTPWNALKISRGFLRAENHLSRCLLFPDWMHTLVSSNQHGVLTAWLSEMPQTQARAVQTAKEGLTNGYPLGTFSRESSQYHKYYTSTRLF